MEREIALEIARVTNELFKRHGLGSTVTSTEVMFMFAAAEVLRKAIMKSVDWPVLIPPAFFEVKPHIEPMQVTVAGGYNTDVTVSGGIEWPALDKAREKL